MGEAVIVDDGGSTRIKQLPPATKKMDDLLSDKSDSPEGTFDKLRVVFLDKDGATIDTRERDLESRDSFVIQSGHGQMVSGEISGNGSKLTISLTSTAAGGEPLVEAKQHKQQRRYIVSNAGPIEKVDYTDFDGAPGTQPETLFDITKNPDKKSVYTMVILT